MMRTALTTHTTTPDQKRVRGIKSPIAPSADAVDEEEQAT
jgi:hypothetical protein